MIMKAEETINGKDTETIVKELNEPFEESCFEERDDYKTLPYHVIKGRFDDVFGLFNYQLHVTDAGYEKIAGSHVLLGNAHLKILYDNGSVAWEEQFPCATDIIVASESQKCTSISNSSEFLFQNALKKGGKLLGIGVAQLRKMRNKKSSSNKGKAIHAFVHVNSAFTKLGTSGYKASVIVDEWQKEECELCIFKKGMASIEKVLPMTEFLKKVKIGSSFHIEGVENTYQGKKQIILNEMVKAAS